MKRTMAMPKRQASNDDAKFLSLLPSTVVPIPQFCCFHLRWPSQHIILLIIQNLWTLNKYYMQFNSQSWIWIVYAAKLAMLCHVGPVSITLTFYTSAIIVANIRYNDVSSSFLVVTLRTNPYLSHLYRDVAFYYIVGWLVCNLPAGKLLSNAFESRCYEMKFFFI